jgi:dihydroorotase
MLDLVIKGATIVTPEGVVEGDLGIRGERIARIAPGLTEGARRELDARGGWLFPGAIDPHVHLRDPGAPHKEDLGSGTRAAIEAGVTTVFDMPNTNPPTLTVASLEAKIARAQQVAACRVAFFLGASAGNAEQLRIAESRRLAVGVKFFFSGTTGTGASGGADALECLLRSTRLPVAVHAEDEGVIAERAAALPAPTDPERFALHHAAVRPVEAARRAVVACLQAARRAGRGLHFCHLSSEAELAEVEAAGLPGVTTEVTPHHAGLAIDGPCSVPRAWLKANPPIRVETERARLFAALVGGRVDVLGSDHAPHTVAEKSAPEYARVPSGVPGVETLPLWTLALVDAGLLEPVLAARLLAGGAARAFGLADRGQLREGTLADLALWPRPLALAPFDPVRVRSRCAWSPFAGHLLPARGPALVVLGGRVVVDSL